MKLSLMNRAMARKTLAFVAGLLMGGSALCTNAYASLEGMMLKLKLQYFGHLMRTVESLAQRVKHN